LWQAEISVSTSGQIGTARAPAAYQDMRRVVAIAVLVLAGCGDGAVERPAAAHEPAAESRPHGVTTGCDHRSGAAFGDIYSDRDTLVVGPFALVGAGYTPVETVREYGGDKFPALVREGHRVTVSIARPARRTAGLAYGPLPQGEIAPADGHRVVTFVACRRGEPSGSTADGEPVTFWSGFVLTARPGCVPLKVWVDDEPAPRRAVIPFGVPTRERSGRSCGRDGPA